MKHPRMVERVQTWVIAKPKGKRFTSLDIGKDLNLVPGEVGCILKWQDTCEKAEDRGYSNSTVWIRV